MTVWNQAAYRQRTYKERVYKPVDPVGKKLNGGEFGAIPTNRLMRFEHYVGDNLHISYDAKSCRCGYSVCSKKGPCAPKPSPAAPPNFRDDYARQRAIDDGRLKQELAEYAREREEKMRRQVRQAPWKGEDVREVYRKLFAEMKRVAPHSWFFEIPEREALQTINDYMVRWGGRFNDRDVQAQLANDLRKLAHSSVGPCVSCGRRGVQLAGRVCADMESCDIQTRKNQPSYSLAGM